MKQGQALIEVMVGMGIAAALMPAVVTSFFAARGGTAQEEVRMLASARLRETKEVLRTLKEANWQNIAVNGTYHLTYQGGVWSIVPGSETNLDGLFTRQITISDAYRDVSGLFAVAGSLDPSVKHISVSVSWTNPLASSVSSEYYLMRFTNQTWLQTLVADFTPGTQTGTTITNVSGGEITLGSGGLALADWCDPNLSLTAIDLPKNGVANAVSAAVGSGTSPNQVVAGTGDNSSGISFGHVTVQNANPPSGSVDGTFDGYKTNGVFVLGTYAYLATDNNAKEVVIIDLSSQDPSTGKYSEAGYFNVPGNSNANSLFAVGSLGFALSGSRLYSFDLSSKSGDRGSPLATLELSGTGSRLVISGSYVYIAESSGTHALEIIQFTPDGKSLSLAGYANLPGQNGVDIIINSTASRGYLATSQGNVYILNTTAPYTGALPSAIGSFNTNGMTPKGVAVVTNNKAIVVGTGGALQYQVIDITNEANPVLCTNGGTTAGGLAIGSGVNGLSSVQEEDGDTYSYIITGDATAELKIIQGGPGGGGGTYASSGIFESSIFDAGSSVMFNRFDVNAATPVDTTIKYQVAITSPVAGLCTGASYTFVGPDKLTSSYFTSSSQLPLGTGVGYTNPGQCLKYRAYLSTTNLSNAPTMYDLTFNYSP